MHSEYVMPGTPTQFQLKLCSLNYTVLRDTQCTVETERRLCPTLEVPNAFGIYSANRTNQSYAEMYVIIDVITLMLLQFFGKHFLQIK